jgi:prepilin-type N-terminal cleavage/methylation domain-containing protein
MDRSVRWATTNRANIAHYFQRHKEMKLTHHSHQSGFTLAEILTAMAIAVVIFAAIITASLAMQKSFNAVDHYFATHIQQVRIIDYLNRDVKRALICTTSANQQTVTLTIPKYIIQSGDAEAVSNPSLVGAMRSPTISTTTSGVQVNYGTATSTVVYSINGASILRTEDGVVTTIASSTDQLVPSTTDADLANTEKTTMAVTFQPIFTSGNVADERTGTTVFSLAYLRNKRRG